MPDGVAVEGSTDAGHVTLTKPSLSPAGAEFHVILSRYRESGPSDVDACPEASKYSVLSVPNVIANCGEVMPAAGVVRKSSTIAAMRLAAAVCEVAWRFVCTPTGIKPTMAIRQNPATPNARTTSTKENAAGFERLG